MALRPYKKCVFSQRNDSFFCRKYSYGHCDYRLFSWKYRQGKHLLTNMKQNQFIYLTGKSKKQILDEFGHEFNYYPSNIWTYEIGSSWLGRRKFLIIEFEKDIAKTIKIKTCYGKFNFNKL